MPKRYRSWISDHFERVTALVEHFATMGLGQMGDKPAVITHDNVGKAMMAFSLPHTGPGGDMKDGYCTESDESDGGVLIATEWCGVEDGCAKEEGPAEEHQILLVPSATLDGDDVTIDTCESSDGPDVEDCGDHSNPELMWWKHGDVPLGGSVGPPHPICMHETVWREDSDSESMEKGKETEKPVLEGSHKTEALRIVSRSFPSPYTEERTAGHTVSNTHKALLKAIYSKGSMPCLSSYTNNMPPRISDAFETSNADICYEHFSDGHSSSSLMFSPSVASSSKSLTPGTQHHVEYGKTFISSRGNEYFCEIDEDYLTDRFNLTGLNTDVTYYQYALDLVTDVFDLDCDDEMREQIEKSARHLYGLVHARYITTTRGLSKMLEKYKKGDFGKCPRVDCKAHHLLPTGMADTPNTQFVKLYCAKCEDLYNPKSSRHSTIDGAYFGTSFQNILFQVYPLLVPEKSTTRYVPRVFGFKMHASAALQRWQDQRREEMVGRLRVAGLENPFVSASEEVEEMEEDEDGEEGEGEGMEIGEEVVLGQ